MPEVRAGDKESIESALKRFKKKIQQAGILSEIKRRECYEKPSVKRKRKSEAAPQKTRLAEFLYNTGILQQYGLNICICCI